MAKIRLILILATTTFGTLLQAGAWDGRYSSSLEFKMASASVCPRFLPINIEINVTEGNVSGVILNNGGGNTHEFCKLYHNGKINGNVKADGSVNINIQQTDLHSRQYSSYRISGQIDGRLTLISRSAKYHPPKSFSLIRHTDPTAKSVSGNKTATSSTAKVAQPVDILKVGFGSLSLQERKSIQEVLKAIGFYKSSIDGLYGRGTKAAISEFARKNGYSITNSRAISTTLSAILEKKEKEQRSEVVIATNVEIKSNSEQNSSQGSGALKVVGQTENELASVENTVILQTTKNGTNSSENVDRLIATNRAIETKWQQAADTAEAQQFIDEIQAAIVMYMAIREVVIEQPKTTRDKVLSVVDDKITSLNAQRLKAQESLTSRFSTPIKPTNANLAISAFRAADTFPKVPFYVPGTNEIGEVLVIPRVSDEGYLNYQFDFIDPTATYDKVRDSLGIPHEAIEIFIMGLGKIDEWTEVAQENGVTRRLAKTASCIPENACKIKQTGISSTELIFQIYEDGSTSGRIQLNKGKFSVGYNMSVESSILLQAYMMYMRDAGAKEFNIGVMSDDELLELFD